MHKIDGDASLPSVGHQSRKRVEEVGLANQKFGDLRVRFATVDIAIADEKQQIFRPMLVDRPSQLTTKPPSPSRTEKRNRMSAINNNGMTKASKPLRSHLLFRKEVMKSMDQSRRRSRSHSLGSIDLNEVSQHHQKIDATLIVPKEWMAKKQLIKSAGCKK
jgi:hypothetical protein